MIKKINAQNVKLRWTGAFPSAKKRIALLIPQYNEGRNFNLENRLIYYKQLAADYRDLLDVILIDDGSTDGSQEYILEFCTANPGCFFFASVQPNAEKVGALYLASIVIEHQYVLLSDFDTDLVNLHHLEKYLDECDADHDVMGCYFRMIPFEGRGNTFMFQQIEYSFARKYYRFHRNDQSVPVMPGAGSCFKREMLLEVYARHSGFRNGEDREATVLGLKLGYKTIYANSVLALTRPPQTFNALLIQRKRWYLGYIESVFKERSFYTNALLKGKSIGWRTLMDGISICLLVLLPVEVAFSFLLGWKAVAGILAVAYTISFIYYYALFIANAEERTELEAQHKSLIVLYPTFWLTLSFLAWWMAFLAFRPGKFMQYAEDGEIGDLSVDDVLINYDPATAIITEPFIGQAGYLKILNGQAARETLNETPFEDIRIFLDYVDTDALESTVAWFIERHESLRTICPVVDGETKQVVIPYHKQLFPVHYVDTDSIEEYKTAKKRVFLDAAKKAADIRKGPLTYIFLFKIGDVGYNFHLLIHHLFKDQWSLKVVRNELEGIYSAFLIGEEPALKPMPVQLRHFCERENNWQRTNAVKIGAFWQNKLSDFYRLPDISFYYHGYSRRNNGLFPEKTGTLPYTDHVSLKKVLDSQEGAQCLFSIGSKRLDAIRMLAQRNESSVSAVMFSAFSLLHYVYTGQCKTLMTVPIANRTSSGYRNIIGWLLGAIYLPYQITEDAIIGEMIAQTFIEIDESINHIIYNRELLGLDEDLLITSSDFCVNYMFAKEPAKLPSGHGDKLHLPDSNIWYGINCQLVESPEILNVKLQYNTTLFSQELINDLVQCFEEILEYITVNNGCSVKELRRHMTATRQTV